MKSRFLPSLFAVAVSLTMFPSATRSDDVATEVSPRLNDEPAIVPQKGEPHFTYKLTLTNVREILKDLGNRSGKQILIADGVRPR